MNNKVKPELLAPAGNLEKLKIAIKYGADAVYIGGRDFSLRANADNFSIEEIKEATAFAHDRDAKVYVTVNIVFHNDDLAGLEEYLFNLEKAKVDAIIISDPIVIEYAKRVIPNMEIHLSTQASTANYEAIKYWLDLGVKRIILARETSKEEIKEIIEKTGADVEIFVHGAMCIGYSGRCALSNYLTLRDSNRGGCSQICRWEFELKDDKKEPVNEVNFSMASKDLILAKHIPELIDINVKSFKIEGRMRSIYYIATIVSIYRKIIDEYISKGNKFEYNDEYENILNRCANREATTQFYNKPVDYTDQYYSGREEQSNQDFLGVVISYDKNTKLATIEQRNLFKVGDKVTIFGPEIDDLSFSIEFILDDNNNKIDAARHPQQIVKIPVNKEVYIDNMMRINND
ncbi:MAG: U32 family peptidase [Bacilli bacterium]|nr:U32 family peptidase [Bacilli bacterium]